MEEIHVDQLSDLTPSAVEDTVIGYVSWLAQTENNKMIKLAGLTLVQEFLKKDCSDGRLKVKLLQNGVLDGLINAFDMGVNDPGDFMFLDVALKCLFHLSKLSISPMQPMISENIIRRLLMVMDLSQIFFQFSYIMKKTCKELCENKHLIGKVESVKMNSNRWENVHKMSKNSLHGRKDLPDSIYFCSLYNTDEEDQDICELLVDRGLAWPVGKEVGNSNTTDDGVVQEESIEDIVVTRFVNGPVFWARIGIDTIQNAHDIQAFLRSQYLEAKLSTCKAKKNNHVVVRRTMEHSIHFYRASVTGVDHMTAKVWLVDYGYEVTVGHESLFSLPDSVSLDVYPPQIALCCLKGIQDPPLCLDSVKTAVIILNNLCHKSMPAGEMLTKLEGLGIIERLLQNSPDPSLDCHLYRLIENLTYNSWMESHLSETNLVMSILGKLEKYLEEIDTNKDQLVAGLHCLAALLHKKEENRASFYQHDGIGTVLKCIMLSDRKGKVYRASARCLKSFLGKTSHITEEAELSHTVISQTSPPRHKTVKRGKRSSLPNEMSRLVLSEEKSGTMTNESAPLVKSLERERLIFDDNSDSDEYPSTVDPCSRSDEMMDTKSLPTGDGSQGVMHPERLEVTHNTKSCLSLTAEGIYVYDTEVEFRSDVAHELRPNKNISKVSASIIVEHVCGMLNTGKGGVIYFGISQDGFVHGIPLSRDQKDEFRLGVDRLMSDKLNPCLLHSMYHVEYVPVFAECQNTQHLFPVPNVYIAEIHIKPLAGTLYTVVETDQCFYRFGSDNLSLSTQELHQLIVTMEEDNYRDTIMKLQLELQELKTANTTAAENSKTYRS